MVRSSADNLYGTSTFIVDSSAAKGSHTTITSAIASASSGDTIFVRPGTFTEDFTVDKSLNFIAYDAINRYATISATITGKITISTAINVGFTGFQFTTNSDNSFNVTGNGATVNISNCYFNTTNANSINATGNSSTNILLENCSGSFASTRTLFITTNALIWIKNSYLKDVAGTLAASTSSAGIVTLINSSIVFPLSVTSTGSIQAEYTVFGPQTNVLNQTWITTAGTGVSYLNNCEFYSGTSTAVSIGSGTTVNLIQGIVNSSNTNAIDGAGTSTIDAVSFVGTSIKNNVTTQNYAQLGAYGTWTPTLIGGSTAGSTTYTTQVGQYHRIGNLVWLQGTISISAATGTGDAKIGGFPFTVKNVSSGNPIGSIMIDASGWTWPVGKTSIAIYGQTNATTALVGTSGTAGGLVNLQMTNAAASFYFTLVYEV